MSEDERLHNSRAEIESIIRELGALAPASHGEAAAIADVLCAARAQLALINATLVLSEALRTSTASMFDQLAAGVITARVAAAAALVTMTQSLRLLRRATRAARHETTLGTSQQIRRQRSGIDRGPPEKEGPAQLATTRGEAER